MYSFCSVRVDEIYCNAVAETKMVDSYFKELNSRTHQYLNKVDVNLISCCSSCFFKVPSGPHSKGNFFQGENYFIDHSK